MHISPSRITVTLPQFDKAQGYYATLFKEGNQCHEPAGSPEGGQFCGTGGGGDPSLKELGGVKNQVYHLLTSGGSYSISELAAKTGSDEKNIKNVLYRIQHPHLKPTGKPTVKVITDAETGKLTAVAVDKPVVGLKPKTEATAATLAALGIAHTYTPTGAKPVAAEKPTTAAKPAAAEKPNAAQTLAAQIKGTGESNLSGEPITSIAGIDPAKNNADYQATMKTAGEKLQLHALAPPTHGPAAEALMEYKETKAVAMAQWEANTGAKEAFPKPQALFAADAKLYTSLKEGMPLEQAVKEWKSDTQKEKSGKNIFAEPKPVAEPKPAAAAKPVPVLELPPAAAGEERQTIPDGFKAVSAADFAGEKTAFGQGMTRSYSVMNKDAESSVANKVGVQAALEAYLKQGEGKNFQEVQAGSSKTSLAAALISNWAGTSADHDALAVSMQLAARDVFGMKEYSQGHMKSMLTASESNILRGAADQIGYKADNAEKLSALRNGLQEFVRAQYAVTQQWFADKGIKEMYLARGMKFAGPAKPELTNLKLQPISSFSAKYDTARGFSGGQSMFLAKVPVSQILSTYLTGFGCTSEHEVTVLANPKMQAVHFGGHGIGGKDDAMKHVQNHVKNWGKKTFKMTKALPVIDVDAELINADWTKQSWDLPPYKSAEFMQDVTDLDAFRQLPVYTHAERNGLIHDDEWVGDYVQGVHGALGKAYSEDEERDEHGRWTSGGGGEAPQDAIDAWVEVGMDSPELNAWIAAAPPETTDRTVYRMEFASKLKTMEALKPGDEKANTSLMSTTRDKTGLNAIIETALDQGEKYGVAEFKLPAGGSYGREISHSDPDNPENEQREYLMKPGVTFAVTGTRMVGGVLHVSYTARDQGEKYHKYNPEQERDEHGRWGSGSGQVKQRDIPVKSARALATHKPSTKAKQDLATQAEQHVAKMLGGKTTSNNLPIDIVIKAGGKTYGVEVKSVSDNGNNKITMHPAALERKVAWGRSNHATVHTVVVDVRANKIYYRKGVGSFRIHTLTPVDSGPHLKQLLGITK